MMTIAFKRLDKSFDFVPKKPKVAYAKARERYSNAESFTKVSENKDLLQEFKEA